MILPQRAARLSGYWLRVRGVLPDDRGACVCHVRPFARDAAHNRHDIERASAASAQQRDASSRSTIFARRRAIQNGAPENATRRETIPLLSLKEDDVIIDAHCFGQHGGCQQLKPPFFERVRCCTMSCLIMQSGKFAAVVGKWGGAGDGCR